MFYLSQTTAEESPFWTSGRVDAALGRSPFSQFNPDPPIPVWGSGLIRSPPVGQLPLMTRTTAGSLAALQPFKVVKEEMKSPSSGPRSSSVAYQNWCHFCPGSCQGACFWHQAGVTFSSAEWAWLTQWMVGIYNWLRQQEMMKIGPTHHKRCAQSKASVTKDGSPTACSQWAEFCTWVCCMKCWSWDTFLCSCKVFLTALRFARLIFLHAYCVLGGGMFLPEAKEANRIRYEPMKSTKDKIIYQLHEDRLLESRKLMLKSSFDTLVTLLLPATLMQAACGPVSLI